MSARRESLMTQPPDASLLPPSPAQQRSVLKPWEAAVALSPNTVDERLEQGAAEEGWRIVPKIHGASLGMSYVYVAPSGARFSSLQAARSSLHDGGTAALEAEQRAARSGSQSAEAAAAEAAAYQAVQEENLTLVRSESSKTGFKCVSYNKALGLRPYKLKVSGRDLGTFSTPVEAALAYARHMAAAADAELQQPVPGARIGARGQKRRAGE